MFLKGINRKAYLEYSRRITEKENKLIKEINEWLPDEIIDCHAHSNLAEFNLGINEHDYWHMLSTFPSFSLEESNEWNNIFHPNKTIYTLRFPGVSNSINHERANLYLLEKSSEYDRVAVFGLSDNIDYTLEIMKHPKATALKMYYSYPDPPANYIYDFFPKDALKLAEEIEMPIILHTPLPIHICIKDVLNLISDFPNLKICFAHLGLVKFLFNDYLEALKKISNNVLLMFDTALVPSSDVVEGAIRILGAQKIMFGSDAPANLIRSVAYKHPEKGTRLAVNFPYHWVDKDEYRKYGHLAKNTTHAHWQALTAIKEAISRFPINTQDKIKKCIFFENAKSFYGF